jgi:hypothetical protein
MARRFAYKKRRKKTSKRRTVSPAGVLFHRAFGPSIRRIFFIAVVPLLRRSLRQPKENKHHKRRGKKKEKEKKKFALPESVCLDRAEMARNVARRHPEATIGDVTLRSSLLAYRKTRRRVYRGTPRALNDRAAADNRVRH